MTSQGQRDDITGYQSKHSSRGKPCTLYLLLDGKVRELTPSKFSYNTQDMEMHRPTVVHTFTE